MKIPTLKKIKRIKKIKKQEIYNILFFAKYEEGKDTGIFKKGKLKKVIRGIKKYRETRKGLKPNPTFEQYKKMFPVDHYKEIKKVGEYEAKNNA